MRIAALAFLAATPLAITDARAADIDASSHIDTVTVFPDGAMVTRLADVTLPAGDSTLLIKGLPAVLDPASVRVEAIADGALAIGAVETRLSPGDAKPVVDAALEAKITALKDESEKMAARASCASARPAPPGRARTTRASIPPTGNRHGTSSATNSHGSMTTSVSLAASTPS